MKAWRTPSSKIPIAAAPANRIQNRRVRTARRTLRRRSELPAGGISCAAETAPGADVSWRPVACAATSASAARISVWPALSGSPKVRPERVVGRAGPLEPGAGTTIAGPLVIIQTNATPTRQDAMKTSEVDRQPAVSINPAASGNATATPMPGPAYAIPSASPDIPAYRRAIAVEVPMNASCSPIAMKTP